MAEHRGGGTPLLRQTWIWALVAVVATAALMVWLANESAQVRAEMAVVEEENDEDPEDEEEAEWITVEGMAADPGGFDGMRVNLENVRVAAPLGPRAFWADVEGGSLVLVVVAPDLTEAPEITQQDTLHITGFVETLTDSAISEWVASNVLDPEAREQIQIASHYIFGERAIDPRNSEAEPASDTPDDN